MESESLTNIARHSVATRAAVHVERAGLVARVSIGIAAGAARDLELLVGRADQALYVAKSNGGAGLSIASAA